VDHSHSSHANALKTPPALHSAVAKKGTRNRVKSVYRDAWFRPLFTGLALLRAEQIRGETSVTIGNPQHPLFSILRLDTRNLQSLQRLPPYPLSAEDLNDAEIFADARNWKQFYVETPVKHDKPATARELSPESRIEWLHHTLRLMGPAFDFTVHLSADISSLASSKPSAASWLQKRIAKRLRQQLGFNPEFWFIFEASSAQRLHIHGEIGVPKVPVVLKKVRRALRLACGEWQHTRQHQVRLRPNPSAWWPNYVSKDAIFMKPRSLPCGPKRRVSGEWFAATNGLRSYTNKLYTECREHVLAILPEVIAKRMPAIDSYEHAQRRAMFETLPARKVLNRSQRATTAVSEAA